MSNCICSIHAGSPFGNVPPKLSKKEALKEIDWPAKCLDCGGEVASPEGAIILRTRIKGIQVICPTCEEIGKCFFCSCDLGKMWASLKRNYHNIPLGNLTNLLSKEAKDILIEKVDQWIEEDNEKEDTDKLRIETDK